MVTQPRSSIEQAALGWLVRIGDPDFADWEALTEWLEAAPEHAQLFNRLRARELDAVAALAAEPMSLAPAANDDEAPAHRWPARAAIAAALLLVFALAVPLLLPHGESAAPTRIATAPGEFRTVPLGAGRSVTLNGGSRISVSADGSEATLLAGEALFDIAHDPRRPFRVRSGAFEIRDIGTRFDVAWHGTALSVAVAEGTVSVSAGKGRPIEVTGGQAVEIDRNVARRRDIAPGRVGSWHAGRLYFENAPLARVAADVEAATGVRVALPPQDMGLRFSGTIVLAGDREALRRQIEAMFNAPITAPEAE